MTGPHLPAASRRAVVGVVAVGLGGVSGCRATSSPDPRASGSATPSAGSAARGATSPTGDPDLDAELVRRTVAQLTDALSLATGVARARRSLAGQAAAWRTLHRAHLEALEAEVRVRPARVTGSSAALRRRLRAREAALQRQLAAASVGARSGPLAALLATMSAAVAQHLVAPADGAGP